MTENDIQLKSVLFNDKTKPGGRMKSFDETCPVSEGFLTVVMYKGSFDK